MAVYIPNMMAEISDGHLIDGCPPAHVISKKRFNKPNLSKYYAICVHIIY